MFVTPGSRAGRGAAASTLYNLANPTVTVPYASTVTLDFNNGRTLNFIIGSLTGNLTLANPVRMKIGQSGYVKLVQDGTGSRTLTLGSYWKCPGGAPTASTAASSVDFLFYVVESPILIRANLSKAFS